LSLKEENISREPWFKQKIVIVKERFIGATHKAFEYQLPKEVLAVKRMWIQFDYYGASMQMNLITPW
jgi:hypothetical protein